MHIITHAYTHKHTHSQTLLLHSNLCNVGVITAVYFLEMRLICHQTGSLKLHKQAFPLLATRGSRTLAFVHPRPVRGMQKASAPMGARRCGASTGHVCVAQLDTDCSVADWSGARGLKITPCSTALIFSFEHHTGSSKVNKRLS